MHLSRSKLKIAVSGRRNKKKRTVKEDIVPVIKPKKKKNKLKILKSPIKEKRKIDERKKYKALFEWTNLLAGHTAFILGNAPGIEQENLSLLNNYLTIGVNRIFYIYDPTILIWQDRQVWNGDKKSLLKQKAIKVCGSKADPRNYFLNFRVKLGPYRFGDNPSVLHGTGNTTVLAVQFAVNLGCSNIVLLGTDCKYGAKGKTDFYGRNKDHKSYTLKMCRGAMRWLKDVCPVTIYNCCGNKLWETQKLAQVINEIRPVSLSREAYRKVFSK